jgi:short-subunit dehydrogenase
MSTFPVAGSHVVVTGGSRGIGAGLAAELSRRGGRVTVVARSAGPLEEVAREIGGNAVTADLASMADVDGLISRIEAEHGYVDVLVNNAALVTVRPIWSQTACEVRQTLLVNLCAPMELTRQVLPGMIARGRGQVVNLSSVAAMSVVPTVAPYCASKAGLAQFTATVQRELRGSGVHMMIVHLGQVDDTDMMADAFTSAPIAVAARRMERVKVMPGISVAQAAAKVADEIGSRRRALIVPAALAPLHYWREAPNRVNDLLTAGREARLFHD